MVKKKPESPSSIKDLIPGMVVDIRALERISKEEKCLIVVYFEEDLVYNSTYEQDKVAYEIYPEHERPFIMLPAFLSFQRDMNPLFDEALENIPFGVKIISNEISDGELVIKGLLPFLDEMDLS